MLDESATGFAIVHLDLSYERAIEPDDDVEVQLRVLEMGTSSIPMAYEISADDAIAAAAETTVVSFDSESGKSFPVPDEWRRALERYQVAEE